MTGARRRAELEQFPAAGPSPLLPGRVATTARNDDDRTQSGPHIPELLAVLWKRPWWAAGLIMAVGAVTGAASALLMPRGPV